MSLPVFPAHVKHCVEKSAKVTFIPTEIRENNFTPAKFANDLSRTAYTAVSENDEKRRKVKQKRLFFVDKYYRYACDATRRDA